MKSAAIRALACFIGTAGAFIVNSPFILLIGLLFIMVVLIVQRRLHQFIRFSYVVLLPLAIPLIFIWGFLLNSEYETIGSGVCAAVFAVARLAMLSGMFLAMVLTLSPQSWARLCRLFGARGWSLAIVISCMNLWLDCREQIRQIYSGHCARGLAPSCCFWVKLWQLPILVRSVFIALLTDSVERAKRWESNNLIARLDHLYKNDSISEECSQWAAVSSLIISIVWTTSAAVCRFEMI